MTAAENMATAPLYAANIVAKFTRALADSYQCAALAEFFLTATLVLWYLAFCVFYCWTRISRWAWERYILKFVLVF